MKILRMGTGPGGIRKRSKSLRSYWKTLNFSPDSDGETNRIALNTALTDKRYVKIVTPGVYNFDSTIWIPSDTTLVCCAGVTFKKETGSTPFSHILANKGMLTGTRNTNIKIYGNGLKVDINGIDYYSAVATDTNPIPETRAVCQFFGVDNLIIKGIEQDDLTMLQQWFIDFTDCTFGEVSGLDMNTYKGTFNLLGSSDFNISNCKLYSWDDAFFIGIGYPQATGIYKDTERINITDIEVGCPTEVHGYVARIWGGSWSDWASGQTYHDQESCVGSNGVIYAKGWGSGGDQVASVEPTHLTGIVIGADGIPWQAMRGTGYSSKVKDVTFRNITLTSNRVFAQFGNNYATAGTEGEGLIDNITFDNISLPEGYSTYCLNNIGYIGNLTLKNTNLSIITGVASGLVTFASTYKTLSKFNIDNCNLTLTGTKLVHFSSDYSTIGELNINNSDIICPALVNRNSKTNCIATKLVVTDSSWVGVTNWFGYGMFTGDNVSFVRSTISVSDRLLTSAVDTVTTLRFTDCIFTNCKFIVYASATGCNVNVISVGSTFSEPISSGYLFVATYQDGVTLNISNSSGIVTASKVRYDSKVKITACDLTYV